MLKQRSFLLLILALLFASASNAQSNDTINLETVEVLGHKALKETAVNKTRVDTLALMRTIDVSLSELLTESTPVFVKTYGRGSTATVSFRGTGASHTNVLWNGININSPMMGMTDVSLIPVYLIDNLSLLHGSSSLSSGSGGFGGSVLIENKADWGQPFSVDFIQGIGSFNTFDDFLGIKGGTDRFRTSTRLFYSTSVNDFTYQVHNNPDPNSNGTFTQHNASYTKYGGLQELYWMLDQKNILSLKVWSQYNKREIPNIVGVENIKQQNHQTDKNNFFTADWKHVGDRDQIFKLQAGYIYNELLYYLAIQNIQGKYNELYDSRSYTHSALAKTSYEYPLTMNFLLLGDAEYRYDQASITNHVNATGYGAKQHHISSKLQAIGKLSDRFSLNFLTRLEWIAHNRDFEKVNVPIEDDHGPKRENFQIIPSLGVDYLVMEKKDWYLTANVARNYHFPTLNELYFLPGGNPGLRPENGISFEVGSHLDLVKTSSIKLNLAFTAYHSMIDDWIVWIQKNQYAEAQNLKKVEISGLESYIKLDGEFKGWKYQWHANYAITKSINKSDFNRPGDISKGKQLPYIPEYSANMLFGVKKNDFYFNYNFTWYSQRYTTSGNLDSKQNALPAYDQHDLAMGYDFQLFKYDSGLEFKVNNLLDEAQETILRRPMPGRYFTLLFKIKFQKQQ